MSVELSELEIVHNPGSRRFETSVGGARAFISYRRTPQGLVLDHTWVPPEFEGRGLAGRLTRMALDYARAEHLAVVPECPYVAAYIRKHPEYQDLVAAASR